MEGASIPEPLPKQQGIPVTPLVLRWLDDYGKRADIDVKEVKALIQARDAFGRKKYSQPLLTADGRDGIEDARQELGDAIQYLVKARYNGKDTTVLHQAALFVLALTMKEA